MPRIAVVIVTHDDASDLPACFDALRAQDEGDFELIVVDNASRDGSADLARQPTEVQPSVGELGLVNGHPPGGGPYVPNVQTFSRTDVAQYLADSQDFGTPPSDPLNGPYDPFQRWMMRGKYLNWPRSVHGELFFSIGLGLDRLGSIR